MSFQWLVEGKDGDAAVHIDGREIRIPELAGILLDQTRRFAERVGILLPMRN